MRRAFPRDPSHLDLPMTVLLVIREQLHRILAGETCRSKGRVRASGKRVQKGKEGIATLTADGSEAVCGDETGRLIRRTQYMSKKMTFIIRCFPKYLGQDEQKWEASTGIEPASLTRVGFEPTPFLTSNLLCESLKLAP